MIGSYITKMNFIDFDKNLVINIVVQCRWKRFNNKPTRVIFREASWNSCTYIRTYIFGIFFINQKLYY